MKKKKSTYRISCEVATEHLKDVVVEVLEYIRHFGQLGCSRTVVMGVKDNYGSGNGIFSNPDKDGEQLEVDIDGDGSDRFVNDVQIEEIEMIEENFQSGDSNYPYMNELTGEMLTDEDIYEDDGVLYHIEKSSRFTKDRDLKNVFNDEAEEPWWEEQSDLSLESIMNEIIKKLPNGKYRLYSKKKAKDGKRKNLGTYDTKEDAKKREKQVQYFKYKNSK